MKIEVEADKKLDEGKHEGVIIDVEYRTDPYHYTDLVIEVGDSKIKAGFPTLITKSSKLGKLLDRFGLDVEVGTTIDPNSVLVGEQCTFLVEADGEYSKVVTSTVKPV